MHTKLNKLFLFLILLFTANAYSQKVNLVALMGHAYHCSYYDGYNRIEFNDATSYGGMITFSPNKFAELGLVIMDQKTKCDAYGYNYNTNKNISETNISIGVTNYQISLVRNFYLPSTEVVSFFAGGDIGIINYSVKSTDRNYIKMGFGIKGGVKIQPTPVLSFRGQFQFQAPITGVGLGLTVGTGGVGVGAGAYSTCIQWSFVGGLGLTFEPGAK